MLIYLVTLNLHLWCSAGKASESGLCPKSNQAVTPSRAAGPSRVYPSPSAKALRTAFEKHVIEEFLTCKLKIKNLVRLNSRLWEEPHPSPKKHSHTRPGVLHPPSPLKAVWFVIYKQFLINPVFLNQKFNDLQTCYRWVFTYVHRYLTTVIERGKTSNLKLPPLAHMMQTQLWTR